MPTCSVMDMDGIVVIGEGVKDKAPMLYINEHVGSGVPPRVDVAVDPIDGTRLLSQGLPNALSVVAIAERGSLYHTDLVYMNKIAVGPAARGAIDITASIAANLKNIAKAKGYQTSDLSCGRAECPSTNPDPRDPPRGAHQVFFSGSVRSDHGPLPRPDVDVWWVIGRHQRRLAACALKCWAADTVPALAK